MCEIEKKIFEKKTIKLKQFIHHGIRSICLTFLFFSLLHITVELEM